MFRDKISPQHRAAHDDIVHGLGRVCAGTMYVYLFLKVLVFAHGQHWTHINTPMGYWFLVEMLCFVLVPVILYTYSVRARNLTLIQVASVLTLVGIVLNRLNVSVIAYNWHAVNRYVPSWMEIEVTLAIVVAEILVLRWIVNRMPILSEEQGRPGSETESQTLRHVV